MKKIIGIFFIGFGVFFIFQNTSGSWLIGIALCLAGFNIYKNNLGVFAWLGAAALGLLALLIVNNKMNLKSFKSGKGVVNSPKIIFESTAIKILRINQINPEKWEIEFVNFTSDLSSGGTVTTSNFHTGDTTIEVTNYNRNNDDTKIIGFIYWS